MKSIAITRSNAKGDNLDYLLEIDIPVPIATGRDLLIEVKAIAVNPADVKVRAWHNTDTPRVLGWDAVGIVKSIGENVTLFKPGDEVWYAGALTRPGSNSEYQLVDERIVAHRSMSISRAAAAAMPLTSITAWELLFDRFGIIEGGNEGDTLLVVGAAGGVGSMLTQLARQLTKMTVIGTASRPESQEWVRKAGAHEVIDHRKPLDEELARIGISEVTHVASLTNTDEHYSEYIKIIAPQGKLGIVDDPECINAVPLKGKCISLHWEAMFARSMFETKDMINQHLLLKRVSELVDGGIIQTTQGDHYGNITADNLRKAHRKIETGRMIGKIVLEGF
ncbi:zinc-binding alcohol dehydrogenase family protein [Kluyvera sichuanensis]